MDCLPNLIILHTPLSPENLFCQNPNSTDNFSTIFELGTLGFGFEIDRQMTPTSSGDVFGTTFDIKTG